MIYIYSEYVLRGERRGGGEREGGMLYGIEGATC